VLEVGAGTGINFPHYPASVGELVAVEPEPYLRSRALEMAAPLPLEIRVHDGLAGELEFEDASFDAAVLSGVLCSVPDQGNVLRELHRVVRAEGELRFYEHVRGREPARARWQDAVDHVWPRLMGGCHPNRDTLAAIEESGFSVLRCRGFHFPAGALAFPVAPRIMGAARR
jgi:ubiquinone/menaquinone biosynthesis C-methylase UbiE